MLRYGVAPMFALALGLWAGSAGAETVWVAKTAPYAESAHPSPKVREECRLEAAVPSALQAAASEVELVDALPEAGRTLRLRITDVQAPSGGMFSGPKALEVTGSLYEGADKIGSFRAKRFSAGGPFGGGGTCGMLAKCARALGTDIATWLDAPTMDAEIGDAR